MTHGDEDQEGDRYGVGYSLKLVQWCLDDVLHVAIGGDNQ
jgi:hypothetical protein